MISIQQNIFSKINMTIICLCLIILLLPVYLLGWVSESFRRHSTAGIFKDDYDLLMHPEDITDAEKNLLYTAFSGLSTLNGSWYSEKILGGTDFNAYFLGGTCEYNKWRAILLFEYYNNSDEDNDYLEYCNE